MSYRTVTTSYTYTSSGGPSESSVFTRTTGRSLNVRSGWRPFGAHNRRWFEAGRHRPVYSDNFWTDGEHPALRAEEDSGVNRTIPTDEPEDNTEKPLRVKALDLLKHENETSHHSEEYEVENLVLRRGQSFSFTVSYNRKPQKAESIKLQLAVGKKPKESKETLIRLTPGKKELKNEEWCARIKEDKGRVVTYEVMPPHRAIIGVYTLFIEIISAQDKNDIKHFRYKHKETMYVIFNPWCKEDAVFLPQEDEREEYVMNESGRIFVGSRRQINGRPWNFGQFDGDVLPAAMYLLDISYLKDKRAHADVAKITRALTAMVNSNDKDKGVLTGRWDGSYSGHTNPSAWTGSVAILEEYMKKKRDVKYGQCWVFSGLVTTLCRTLGIPCRSVTNFESAHDTDGSLTIDSHVDRRGRSMAEMDDDSVWNFHVWNEGWFKRPDLPPGYDGWQAFDATPQEESDGLSQCGPASVKALKEGNVFLPYDGRFIFAEVNGDRVTWEVEDGGDSVPVGGEPHSIGQFISTKAVGSTLRQDITGSYKHQEGSKEERRAMDTAIQYAGYPTLRRLYNIDEKHDVTFKLTGDMLANGNLTMDLKMTNKSDKSRSVESNWHAFARYHTGTPGETLDEHQESIIIPAKGVKEMTWLLRARDYAVKLDEDANVGIHVSSRVEETGQRSTQSDNFSILKPELDIKLSKASVRVGEDFDVTIKFTNPLEVALMENQLFIEGAGIQKRMKIKIRGTIMPGEGFEEKVTLTARYKASRPREVMALFNSHQLPGIAGSATIKIK